MDSLKFISIADEKVARVFEAPKAFVRLAKHLQIAGIDVDEVNPLPLLCPPLLIHASRTPDQLERRFRRWVYPTRPLAMSLHKPPSPTQRSLPARHMRENWLL